MDTQVLLATAVLLIALPMAGTLCAMALAVLVAAKRQPWGGRLVHSFAWMDPLMTRMRLAAQWLGSSLDEGAADSAPSREAAPSPASVKLERRAGAQERRGRDRRNQVRRGQQRFGRERRQAERRHALAG